MLLIMSLCASILTFAQNQNDDFKGRWKAPKGDIIIISKSTAGFLGKTEKENAVVLRNVIYSNGKWDAIVLNPRENKIANCELILKDKQLHIIARKGLLHKTIIWIKQ